MKKLKHNNFILFYMSVSKYLLFEVVTITN